MRRRLAPLALALLVPGLAPLHAQASGIPPVPRAEATGIVRSLQRIATPEGIDTLLALPVGDNRQVVSIRGLNRANPVLLYIHGGPASPMLPAAWAFQRPWEDFFTVVQWDQRGAGLSFAGIDTARAAATWTTDEIVDDAVVVIDAVRRLLGKRKVIVLGHSWGSVVGATLAARRPDLLHAYVGVGQVVAWSQERYLYERVLSLARAHHVDSAVADLERLAPYPPVDPSRALRQAGIVRHWANRFNGGLYGHASLDVIDQATLLSPAHRDGDLATVQAAPAFASPRLVGALLRIDLRAQARYRVPIFVLQGRYDLYTPYAVARDWAATVRAPVRRFITFERSAHYPMLEEPGRFLLTLVQEVRPLAHEGAPFAPGPDTPR